MWSIAISKSANTCTYPYFEDFPPIFKNCEVGRHDIGHHLKEFAERHKLLSKPRKMLISSFKLDRGPIITPLLLFYLEKGLVLTDVFWFLQYTPRECFQSFVQNVVDARREGDRNKDSTTTRPTSTRAYDHKIFHGAAS